jgi:hypothetical protein
MLLGVVDFDTFKTGSKGRLNIEGFSWATCVTFSSDRTQTSNFQTS